jgi:hypothetical protein
MVFTNTYTKKTGGTDPEKDPASLVVSKIVSGDFSSSDVYFSYEMTFIKNSLITVDSDFVAYIVDVASNGTATLVPSADLKNTAKNNVSASVSGNVITVKRADTLTFSLKANQKLVFFKIYTGTSYTLKENGTTAYTPKATVDYYDSTGNQKQGVETGSASASLTIPNATTIQGPLYIGETKNIAAFDNYRGTVTPTGLNINDLPFIGMIVLAIGSIIGYIIYKSLKTNKTDKKSYSQGYQY